MSHPTSRAAIRRGGAAGGPILAMDTATRLAVVVLGGADGSIQLGRAWPAGHRHGEELLARISEVLAKAGIRPRDLGAIAVGTGPGAFTGLRVGLATAKTLAHELGLPIVGISTGLALLDAAAAGAVRAGGMTGGAPTAGGAPGAGSRSRAILLPAGPSDLVIVGPDRAAPRLVPGGTDLGLSADVEIVAVDLDGRASPAALAAGAAARDGLGAALLRLAAARLGRGDADDVDRLVPEYVTLPRGVRASSGEVAWSRDRR